MQNDTCLETERTEHETTLAAASVCRFNAQSLLDADDRTENYSKIRARAHS
jgi:hypothetical protein